MMSTATAVKIPTREPALTGEPSEEEPAHGPRASRGRGSQALNESASQTADECASQALSEGELRALRGLMRAHASLAKRLDAELERAHGLPLSSYEVLHHLEGAPEGRMRMCDLAEHAQLSRSGLTRLVDRLERDGLLARCTCEHDARGAYACLTEQGSQRLGDARGTHLEVVREQFLSRFSEPELGVLAEMWDRIAPCCGCSS